MFRTDIGRTQDDALASDDRGEAQGRLVGESVLMIGVVIWTDLSVGAADSVPAPGDDRAVLSEIAQEVLRRAASPGSIGAGADDPRPGRRRQPATAGSAPTR